MEGKTLPLQTGGCRLHPREFLWWLQPARLELTVQRRSSGSTITACHLEPPSHCDNSLLGNPHASPQFLITPPLVLLSTELPPGPLRASLGSPVPTTLHLREDHGMLLQGPATHCCGQGDTQPTAAHSASQDREEKTFSRLNLAPWQELKDHSMQFMCFNITSVHGLGHPPGFMCFPQAHSDA